MRIFVIGFVSHGGVGGFEWRTTTEAIADARLSLKAEGDEFSDPLELDTVTDLGLAADITDRDAITEALDEQPELWNPTHKASERGASKAPTPIQALEAIKARIQGDWDHPSLRLFGALRTDSKEDILSIAEAALTNAKLI